MLVSGSIALAACPNRDSPERRTRTTIATIGGFTDRMCACRDQTCLDAVVADVSAWGAEQAIAGADDKLDEESARTLASITKRYTECMAALATKLAPPPPPPRDDIPAPAQSTNADVLLDAARAFARTKHPDRSLHAIRIENVDANGELAPRSGQLVVTFGRGQPTDRCLELRWAPPDGWTRSSSECEDTHAAANRCSVREIWKRAIETDAPATARANVSFRTTTERYHRWTLRIEANVVVRTFPDDCAVVLENAREPSSGTSP